MSREDSGESWLSHMKEFFHEIFDSDSDSDEEQSTEVNKVVSLDWNISSNAETHHTTKYDLVSGKCPRPVLRRGQTFSIKLSFENKFDADKDRVLLDFKYGVSPSVHKGTKIIVPVAKEAGSKDMWYSHIESENGSDLVVQVHIPATSQVGTWKLDVRTSLQNKSVDKSTKIFKSKIDFYVLFNPWCEDDAVYMEDENGRQEYVMNDYGKIFLGGYKTAFGRPWCYGQFEDFVLPVAVGLLSMSGLAEISRSNPVKVVRGLSGVLTNNKIGVLAERRNGNYAGGVSPFKWVGSLGILESYVRNGCKPVKYVQCWISSAVFTSVCRALGIPCRSITNFVSAHDTGASLTIDKFYTEEGREVDEKEDDGNSLWVFHSWNDVWMTRPDLPEGYNGWQAIDSTSRPENDGPIPCGPVSLKALHDGDLGMNYDALSVFRKINAEFVYWRRDSDLGNEWGWKRERMGNYRIGRAILTKACGKKDKMDQDVLVEYKNLTQTEESLTFKLLAPEHRKILTYKGPNASPEVSLNLRTEATDIGTPLKIKVTADNQSKDMRTVKILMVVHSVRYTGENVYKVKEMEESRNCDSMTKTIMDFIIEPEEYLGKLAEHCLLKIHVKCTVKETGQLWIDQDYYQLSKPKLQIDVPEEPMRVGERCEVKLGFTNPLDIPLTKCHISLVAHGFCRYKLICLSQEVPAKGEFSHTLKLVPRRQGNLRIVASFNACELYDVIGDHLITVKDVTSI